MRQQQQKIRIIGGMWRGRKLPVLDSEGLRPSGDRLRETLFNWLMPVISGARCLDLFAGTGALGLEAASRGASQVTLVEKKPQVAQHLRQQVQTLHADNVKVKTTHALQFLTQKPATPFNLVFLDPPFADDLLPATLLALNTPDFLSPQARIYIEQARTTSVNYPENWMLLKHKTTKNVAAYLFQLQSTQ